MKILLEKVKEINGFNSTPNTFTITEDGKYIITGLIEGSVESYNVPTGKFQEYKNKCYLKMIFPNLI